MKKLITMLLAFAAALSSARAQDMLLGFCVIDADGRTVMEQNATTMMVPASNLKLVTTGAALHAFGPDYRFSTRIGYTGSIGEDGTLRGDVVIIGGGDPTIGAPDSTAYKADALFWKWKTILADAGIKRIEGDIVGDGSAWEGLPENRSWEAADTWTYYGAGASALCFYENAIDLQVTPADKVGEPVNMLQSYPQTPWLEIDNQAVTGPSGSGNSLYLQTSTLSSKAVLTGTYAIDRRPRREQAANKFGALTCAHEFYQNLVATGWEVKGTYLEETPGRARGRTVIGETLSPPLAQICRKTNYDSDNFYAEALLRAMGEAACGVAVYDSCLVAIGEVLEDIVPGASAGIAQKDGSGLSRQNLVSPQWMASYLHAIRGNPAFLESLPHPGEGTLYNLKRLPSGSFRLKSGSMGGVLCYSGYVLDKDGRPRLSFAVFANNFTGKVSSVRPELEELLLKVGKN